MQEVGREEGENLLWEIYPSEAIKNPNDYLKYFEVLTATLKKVNLGKNLRENYSKARDSIPSHLLEIDNTLAMHPIKVILADSGKVLYHNQTLEGQMEQLEVELNVKREELTDKYKQFAEYLEQNRSK